MPAVMINPRFHQMTWRRCWHHLLWWMQSEWWVMNGWNSFRNVQFLCFSLYALIVLIRTVEAYVRNILNKLTLPSLLKLKYAPTHRWSNIFCVHKNRSMMLASIHKSFNEKKKFTYFTVIPWREFPFVSRPYMKPMTMLLNNLWTSP